MYRMIEMYNLDLLLSFFYRFNLHFLHEVCRMYQKLLAACNQVKLVQVLFPPSKPAVSAIFHLYSSSAQSFKALLELLGLLLRETSNSANLRSVLICC